MSAFNSSRIYFICWCLCNGFLLNSASDYLTAEFGTCSNCNVYLENGGYCGGSNKPEACDDCTDCCNLYKDYECPAELKLSNVQEMEITCSNETMVQDTFDLIEEGNSIINFTILPEAVLVIGLSGVGKSTLTYFIGGDTQRMFSKKESPTTYSILDCNGKITGGYISATLFPNLVVLNDDVAFYYNPGFQDNIGPCIEISKSYFIREVT